MSIERILYRSHAVVSTQSLPAMADILGSSRRNNDRDDLTGLLAIGSDHFVQVIEGPGPIIDRLLARLEVDRRHEKIEILHRGPITARLFGGWTMAGVRFTPDFANDLRRLLDDQVDAGEMISIMLSMAHNPMIDRL